MRWKAGTVIWRLNWGWKIHFQVCSHGCRVQASCWQETSVTCYIDYRAECPHNMVASLPHSKWSKKGQGQVTMSFNTEPQRSSTVISTTPYWLPGQPHSWWEGMGGSRLLHMASYSSSIPGSKDPGGLSWGLGATVGQNGTECLLAWQQKEPLNNAKRKSTRM